METPLVIINHHKYIKKAYKTCEEYLKAHSNVQEEIAAHLWAHYVVVELVPSTVERLWAGYFFPFSESYFELESSFEFCKQGFYRHAFFALRCALELVVIGLYFDKKTQTHIDIRRWIRSESHTPDFRRSLRRLFELEYFRQFDDKFALRQEIEEIYSFLNGYVHTRGFHYSSTGQRLSSINQFNESSLRRYIKIMKNVVKSIIKMMLLKYPIGMQKLPLWEKFGFNVPLGGFLNDLYQRQVLVVLDDDTKQVLQKISDNDPTVKGIVRAINAMPDLTEEQLDKQRMELDKMVIKGGKKTKRKAG